MLLGAAWTIALVIRPFKLRFSIVLIPLSATVAWGLFQLAARHTQGRWDTWMAVLIWLGNLLACFLAMQVCASSGIRRRFLNMLVYFAFVLSVVSVVQYFSWDGKIFWIFPTYDTAVLGPFVSRDQYAAFVEMLLPLAIVQTLRGGPQSLRFAVISAALYASVIAGASRAGALLTTAEIIVIPVVFWARGHFGRDKLRSATINVWLLAFVFVAVVGWAVLWSRFDDPDPLKGRREMLSDTISMVRARPYFGFGLGTFRTAYPAYGSVDFGAVAVSYTHLDVYKRQAVIHAKTCSKLTGFPGFLQRVGMLGVGPCVTKIGAPACGAGKVCTTSDSKTGTCKNTAAVGQPANCGCVANTVSKGLK